MNNEQKSGYGAMFFAFATIAVFAGILAIPASREVFITVSGQHHYIMGFIKFCFLSTVGDIIGIRLKTKAWGMPKGVVPKAIVWGLLGVCITLMFQIFGGGVTVSMDTAYLPATDSKILYAILVSAIMNFTFAPTFMAFHRITDTLIDMKCDGAADTSLKAIVSSIDWHGFVSFVVLKTIPFFWVPAHTLTFLVPGEYRVVLAASLSIALGIILALANKAK